MSAGGTEKFLHTIARNLPQDEFDVSYYYCDAAPYIGSEYKHPDTDQHILQHMLRSGINVVKFHVKYKDITTPTHNWIDTDFWELFDESRYDIIQTGRAGHPEYPFIKIRKTPIIDSLHLNAGVDNQRNIAKVMHISNWSARKWIDAGGDPSRVVLVSHPLDITEDRTQDFRVQFSLQDKFVLGMHQRNDDEIFSAIPLEAYKSMESEKTAFLLLGGGERYKQQAAELGVKNFFHIPHTGDRTIISKFLATLDVYSHGRRDGEVNSTAIGEAMCYALPIVSHISDINNGHIECIGNAGVVAKTVDEYAGTLKRLHEDIPYLHDIAHKSKERFSCMYEKNKQIARIVDIYRGVHSRHKQMLQKNTCFLQLLPATLRSIKALFRI